MAFKRTTKLLMICLLISVAVLMGTSGCRNKTEDQNRFLTEADEIIATQNNQEESLVKIPLDIYEKAEEEGNLFDIETVNSVINRFGENGYAAVDYENQINMVHPQKVMDFCESVKNMEKDSITIIQVSQRGGFNVYGLQTEDGQVDVNRSYYEYNNGTMKSLDIGSYQAEYWKYTEEGYLMFSGKYFSEELYILTLSEAEEHLAFRVQPLDETYRELNRKYLLPIGFEQNNMFLVDWSEDDFEELDFYDVYDIFYPLKNGKSVPYVADDNLGVGAVYQIPKDEFENIIMTYFNIDSETLQSKTVFNSKDNSYEYKPRGYYEVEYPEYPYSEVVGYTENSDGTISLMANVVFPYYGDSKVYSHEVVVRPLDNGAVQYVSNKITSSEDNQEETWYTPRLTEEEWEEIYGDK